MPVRQKLSGFVSWCARNISGDKTGQARIFIDRLFQALGQPGCRDVGGASEFRIRKPGEVGDGAVVVPMGKKHLLGGSADINKGGLHPPLAVQVEK